MSKARIFFWVNLAFILGVAFRSYFDLPFFVSYLILLFSLGLIILAWPTYQLRLVGLGLIFLSLGILRYEFSLPKVDEYQINVFNGQNVIFQAVVIRDPDARLDQVKLTVASNEILLEGKQVEASGKVLVQTSLFPQYNYGDKLEISCHLRKPESIHSQGDFGQKEFAYDKYLARYGIYALCYNPKIKLLASDQGNKFKKILLKTKNRFRKSLEEALPEPQSSLLAALLLGAKRSLPPELMEAFRRTGTVHIVVVSGFHITLIAELLAGFFLSLYVPRKYSFWLISLFLLLFVAMIGFPVSAVRGVILGILVLLANYFGRLRKIGNALALTAAFMIFINPKILFYDLGFQLSFLATLGLVYLAPAWQRYFQKVPSFLGLRTNLAKTFSAIILTSPWLLYNFGTISFIAPLANILILMIVPYAMIVGFIAGLVGFISAFLGKIIGFLAWFMTTGVILIVETLTKFKYASWNLGAIPGLLVIIIYLAIGWWIYKEKEKA